MTCQTLTIDGHASYVCTRGGRPKRCSCGTPATRLCDAPTGPRRRCSAPVCAGCTRAVGEDLDACPRHASWDPRAAAPPAPAAKTDTRQLELFATKGR